MAQSCSCGSDQITRTLIEASGIANLLDDVFCACKDDLQNDLGAIACEVFRRVDLEGQRLEVAADGVGLDSRSALAMLVVVRRSVADALTKDVSFGETMASRR